MGFVHHVPRSVSIPSAYDGSGRASQVVPLPKRLIKMLVNWLVPGLLKKAIVDAVRGGRGGAVSCPACC